MFRVSFRVKRSYIYRGQEVLLYIGVKRIYYI